MERLSVWIQMHRWKATAGGVGVLTFWLLVGDVGPRAASAYQLYRNWKRQEARVASVVNWEVEQVQLGAQKRLLQQRFAALYVSLPRSDHMSIILQVLQESADSAAVHVRAVRPAGRTSYAHYDEVPFEVILDGTFHEVASFLSRIEQSPYVIKVRRFMLRRRAPPSAELVAEFLLSVIILKQQGAGS